MGRVAAVSKATKQIAAPSQNQRQLQKRRRKNKRRWRAGSIGYVEPRMWQRSACIKFLLRIGSAPKGVESGVSRDMLPGGTTTGGRQQ